MSGAPTDLTTILRQQQELLDGLADFRAQLTRLTAICTRIEASVQSLTNEVRAMRSQP